MSSNSSSTPVGMSLSPSPQVVSTPIPACNPPVSLYIGDLDTNVNDSQLFEFFSQFSRNIISVRVCRDLVGRFSLGYGYVNFNNADDAAKAINVLNHTPLNGKPIRIMYSNRDPYTRKIGYANLFIKNLDSSIDNKSLHDIFASFGTVLSSKVAVDCNGQSKGFGFVNFDNEESAKVAIEKLNDKCFNEKQVYVGPFIPRTERNRANGAPKFTNVYVKNLLETTTIEDLKKIFEVYGVITSATVAKDENGKSRCFGFINFQSPDSASAAVEKLDGTTLSGDKILYVGRAQKKAEREAELRAKFEQEKRHRHEKLQGANLYLKNLDDHLDDEKLKELFSKFGTITSCKVMLDLKGASKGFGFIAFSTSDEATRAISEMNGKMIGRKPLYVVIAQRKDERTAQLQRHFAQIRTPHLPTVFPQYPPEASRFSPQHLYYGHAAQGMVPPQPAGYGFQQQLMPAWRPGMSPNFMMPYHIRRQGQAMQWMDNRQGRNNYQTGDRNFNRRSSYMTQNGTSPSVVCQGVGPVGPLTVPMPISFEASGIPTTPIDLKEHGNATMSILASATPERQHMMLGDQLFPLVERLEREHARKVTGMLLEMDQTEVIHLIESHDALKAKVAEAMDVLRSASGDLTSD